jgi:pimeloyl-ACP methyl ester carboxylesterase
METIMPFSNRRFRWAAVAGLAVAVATLGTVISQRQRTRPRILRWCTGWTPACLPAGQAKPTVVLVHGAWADASSWSGEVAILQRAGYDVRAIANPLQDLTTDAEYVADYLKTISGPIVLVGHSYGGAVITNAAAGIGAYISQMTRPRGRADARRAGSRAAAAGVRRT